MRKTQAEYQRLYRKRQARGVTLPLCHVCQDRTVKPYNGKIRKVNREKIVLVEASELTARQVKEQKFICSHCWRQTDEGKRYLAEKRQKSRLPPA